ncbi:MAG: S41 family peptidase [Bacteroidota bacterium]
MVRQRAFFIVLLFQLPFFAFTQSNGFEVIKNLEILDHVFMNLEKYYVDEPQTGAISKAGIDAMLKELDPYTVYYHESNIEDYQMMTTGQYGGIGASIRRHGNDVIIAEPYENMPADQAGLKPGDRLISIEGRSVKGQSTEQVSEALKGAKGSTIAVVYERPYKGTDTASVTRAEIKLPDIPYQGLLDDNVGYVKLNSFTKTASREVGKAFSKLKSENMEKFVLDLRGNGGGLLLEAVNIVNFFVPKGTEIVTTKGRILDENRSYTTKNEPLDLDIPIVVLVNETSASASEIVAGALQDLDRAVVVGKTTFGKGLVQRTVDLKYGAKMKLTVAKYYTPSGRCLQKLDYYHKNEGEVSEVPDSLIQIFKTKNGREVIDGRGIEPDIVTEGEKMPRFIKTLLEEDVLFDFATVFAHNNDEIASPKTYEVSDKVLKALEDTIMNRSFDYATATQQQLEKTLQTAKKEGYDQNIIDEYEALFEKVEASKSKDYKLFKSQIRKLLRNEIVGRFYYQEGKVIDSFKDDNDLQRALDLFEDIQDYNAILSPEE